MEFLHFIENKNLPFITEVVTWPQWAAAGGLSPAQHPEICINKRLLPFALHPRHNFSISQRLVFIFNTFFGSAVLLLVCPNLAQKSMRRYIRPTQQVTILMVKYFLSTGTQSSQQFHFFIFKIRYLVKLFIQDHNGQDFSRCMVVTAIYTTRRLWS